MNRTDSVLRNYKSRRLTRRSFLGAAAAAAVAPRFAVAGPQTPPPNILILLADDLRADALFGSAPARVPALQRLAARGTVFSGAHIMGSMSGAVCIPSRAMLLTGRTLFHLQGMGNTIPKTDVMLPELLRQRGYETFHTGKWHQDKASHHRAFSSGDSVFFGGMANDPFNTPLQPYDPAGEYATARATVQSGRHVTEVFADAAVRFLESRQGVAQPFFAYAAFTAPHDPRIAPPEFMAQYRPESMPLPGNFMPEHPFPNGELAVRDEQLAPVPRTPEVIRQHWADYYAAITYLDYHIGRVLDALEKSGQAENTLIFFAGDNGLALGSHGLLGKQNVYEHSVRVPLVAAGPGVRRGHQTEALCYLSDVFPTVCALSGLEMPRTLETVPLPGLGGAHANGRESLFFAYRGFQRAVLDGRWKWIRYHVDGKDTVQLFDLKEDPLELHNLAETKHGAERARAMDRQLDGWMEWLGDPDRKTGFSSAHNERT